MMFMILSHLLLTSLSLDVHLVEMSLYLLLHTFPPHTALHFRLQAHHPTGAREHSTHRAEDSCEAERRSREVEQRVLLILVSKETL